MADFVSLLDDFERSDDFNYFDDGYRLHIIYRNKEIIVILNDGLNGGPSLKILNSYNLVFDDGTRLYDLTKEMVLKQIKKYFEIGFLNKLNKQINSNDIESIRKDMVENGSWYKDDMLVTGKKYIALGRRQYYTEFANNLSTKLGTKVYLLDFMTWVDPRHPCKSLFYYIKSAEKIFVNLEGVTADNIEEALSQDYESNNNLPFMTLWEINQIYFKNLTNKTYWFSSDTISKKEVYDCFKGKIKKENIF